MLSLRLMLMLLFSMVPMDMVDGLGYAGYGLGYAGYGYPYGYSGYYGHYLGKRSADAEPEAKADAALLYGAYGYGGYGLGYAGYAGYGYAAPYSYGYAGYPYAWGK